MTPLPSRHRLTRAILWLIFVAAVASAPVFLVAESFDAHHVLLVLASNGICALLCLLLLHRLQRGAYHATARLLVYGLLALVAWLASTNGEDVHLNVVNFLLVTVLASVLLEARSFWVVTAVSVLVMVAIAWRQAVPAPDEGVAEARVESIAQFLPTYLVITAILWLRERGAARA